MLKRLWIGILLASLLAWTPAVKAQGLSAELQLFWNTLRTGGYAFSTLHLNAGAYENWGATLGTNGYGVRDNGGTIQFKNSGGVWANIVAAITGGACTNQVVTAIATITGVPTCTTVTSAYVDSSVATVGAANAFTAAQSVTVTALASTSTDGMLVQNTTPATMGAPVQISPRSRWCGTAYNSVSTLSETDCFFTEVLPATVAGTTTALWKLGKTIAGGGITYPLTISQGGAMTILGALVTGGTVSAPAGSFIGFAGRAFSTSPADKQWEMVDNGGTTGMEVNVGTPTLGTCTGGTLVSGAHNFGGEVTGTTGGSCAINFGTPNFVNAPQSCWASDETAAGIVNITAKAASGITIGNITSGHNVMWGCNGRIGT